MIEIFKDTKYDFLGKKWMFIGLSWVLILLGLASVLWRTFDGNPNTHAFNTGVDFSGGTIVDVKFQNAPDLDKLRNAIVAQGIEAEKIQMQPVGEEIGQPAKNEVFVRLPNLMVEGQQQAQGSAENGDADVGKLKIAKALASLNDPANSGKTDLNAVGSDGLRDKLKELDPLGLNASGASASLETEYGAAATRIIDHREKQAGGVLRSVDEVKGLDGIKPQVGEALAKSFFAGTAAIRSAEAVSPQVGGELRNRAIYVTLAACAGMLLFVAFRFKSWGFGIGAIIAVIHDVLVTLGLFSIFQFEVNLTVIAALLTLVGYSMNDTIVIFDRIREMMRTRRREGLELISNLAINETLSRTIITSGLTFLTVVALVVFGGEVLRSFSWCLFIGIIIGTYSSIYIASPFMLWWEARTKAGTTREAAAAGAAAALNSVSTAAAATATGQPRRNAKKRR
ncbi:MAG: protein translocase subunit SecF [Blastocatellia bacterium]